MGPRQCGKTTLAQHILKKTKNGVYLNWDDRDHKKTIFKRGWASDNKLIVLDEIHKFPAWKNWLKGTFDTQKNRHQFLITGSARLDLYKKGGDSMMGRYHQWQLHPLTLCEKPKKITFADCYKRLIRVGGFPEPFFDNSIKESRRWKRERFEKVIQQDIRELSSISDLQTLSLLIDLLRERVGSTIVVSNLARDLQKAPQTISNWIDILESMFILFKVKSYTKKLSRAVQKPFKIYFYDTSDVVSDNEGAVFENLVACHLLKQIHFARDSEGHKMELYFLRDKDQREVDFLVTKNNKVEELIEVKLKSTEVSKNLLYYSDKLLPSKSRQIVMKKDYLKKNNQLEIVDIYKALSNPDYFLDTV